MKRGFVYFIEDTSSDPGEPAVKVGFASDPEARRRGLQTGTRYPLKLRAKFPGTRADERYAHDCLSLWRCEGGEWFEFEMEILPAVVAAYRSRLTLRQALASAVAVHKRRMRQLDAYENALAAA